MTPRRRRHGFTLIELLTVIAIIAILAGIIFPVFATVREKARQSSCMSNMRQIAQGVKQYELDNRSFPDFLFSPAIKANGAGCATDAAGNPVYAAPGDAVCSMRVASGTGKLRGLYPEYVKSLESFKCPNNTEAQSAGDAGAGSVATVQRPEFVNGTTQLVNRVYYKFDSYDANLKINSANQALVTPKAFVARYSRVWTNIFDSPSDPQAAALGPAYKRQLYWRTPGDDTYITMCSYHVPSSKVLVLWLNGSVKALDTRKLNKVVSSGGTQDYDMYQFGPLD